MALNWEGLLLTDDPGSLFKSETFEYKGSRPDVQRPPNPSDIGFECFAKPCCTLLGQVWAQIFHNHSIQVLGRLYLGPSLYTTRTVYPKA